MTLDYTLSPTCPDGKAEWDAFINTHPQGHLLQSWGWGELKVTAGWQPLRLALRDERRHIVAAAQVLRRTAPHLPLRVGHLAYIPRGPVIDWSQPALLDTFFTQLHTILKQHGALALHVEPDYPHTTDAQSPVGTDLSHPPFSHRDILPDRWGERGRDKSVPTGDCGAGFHPVQSIQPVRSIVLDITLDEAALLAGMKEKWRYNVRLAARKGVTVRVAEKLDDVRAWYALMQTTGERDAFGIHTLDYYLNAWRIFAPRGQLRLLLAEHDGQPRRLLAGIFVGLMARQAIYLYGASSNEGRNLMPNYLLQWEAIRWAKEQGATSYDFWGIPPTDAADEAMAGVYRFKSGWGGRVVTYPGGYEYVYRPLAMNIARKFLP